jgi:predicted transcriptional regulator
MSLIPCDAKTSEYSSKIELEAAYDDETISSIAKKMRKNEISQLPVFSREEGEYLGLVTELSLLKRILKFEPYETVHELKEKMKTPESLSDFKSMTVSEANVIEKIPDYPLETSFREIAQLLTHYYAIPLYEKTRVTGIITRADILKLLT